jgi:hypothetical protein
MISRYFPSLKSLSQATRESRLIKIPFVKRFGGEDLAVVSVADKSLYREIEETMKKESALEPIQWEILRFKDGRNSVFYAERKPPSTTIKAPFT